MLTSPAELRGGVGMCQAARAPIGHFRQGTQSIQFPGSLDGHKGGPVMAFGGEPLAANDSVQMVETMKGHKAMGDRPAAFVRPSSPVGILGRDPGIRAYILGSQRYVK